MYVRILIGGLLCVLVQAFEDFVKSLYVSDDVCPVVIRMWSRLGPEKLH